MNRGNAKLYIAIYKGNRYGSPKTKEQIKEIKKGLKNIVWEAIN